MPTAAIVLAAGQGRRMNSDLPKVLHPLAGAPLLAHALASLRGIDPERVIVVTGYGAEAVAAAAHGIDDTLAVVTQAEQLGTGHAVLQAAPALAGFAGDAIVLYGDTPFIRPETLAAMLAARADGAAVVVLGFEAAEPGDYGRLVLDAEGGLEAIVEARDATAAQRAIRLCNSGLLAADAGTLLELLAGVGNDNRKGEYYLTDVVGLARARGLSTAVISCPEAETLGINSRADLAAAEAAFQARARAAALENGATLTDPATVWFALDTAIGRDVLIGPNVVFGPGVTVESGATILGFCYLEGCHISRGARIGPFARLRPGAEIAEDVHIGNFVEVKNSIIEEGAKANHLTYVGDARVGPGANLGAGTITCNYDGVFKHRTEIGARAFIGSNTALVAPVRIGAGALVGAGTVVTRDVPDGALAISRGSQETKPGLGQRLMERLRALKARGKGCKLMCGIVAILGRHEVAPLILEALKRLEYRGYDSAGIATVAGRPPASPPRGRQADRALGPAGPGPDPRPCRHRPYPLGHPRPALRTQRPPPPGRRRRGGAQRHHRELPGAAQPSSRPTARCSRPRPTPRRSCSSATASSRAAPIRSPRRGRRWRGCRAPSPSVSCSTVRTTCWSPPGAARRWRSAMATARLSSAPMRWRWRR